MNKRGRHTHLHTHTDADTPSEQNLHMTFHPEGLSGLIYVFKMWGTGTIKA